MEIPPPEFLIQFTWAICISSKFFIMLVWRPLWEALSSSEAQLTVLYYAPSWLIPWIVTWSDTFVNCFMHNHAVWRHWYLIKISVYKFKKWHFRTTSNHTIEAFSMCPPPFAEWLKFSLTLRRIKSDREIWVCLLEFLVLCEKEDKMVPQTLCKLCHMDKHHSE